MSKLAASFILLFYTHSVLAYDITIEDDGPVVQGGTIHITVTVYDDISKDGAPPSAESFKYEWKDDAIPQHVRKSPIQNSTDTWAINYNADNFPLGVYRAQVIVSHCLKIISPYICFQIGSARIEYNITGTLNGNIGLLQKNKTRDDSFVATKDPVVHEIKLKKSDAEYISTAPTVLTYWFIDCVHYETTTDFQFRFNYTDPDKDHLVMALVMADFTPLPPTTTVAPTTTSRPTTTTAPTPTTKSTTTTEPTTTSTKTPPTIPTKVTTTIKLNTTTVATIQSGTSKAVVKRSVVHNDTSSDGKNSTIMDYVNGTLVPFDLKLPYVCNGPPNSDRNKTYGFFYKMVKVKAPISNVNVTGNNWIQQGDLLSLQITCKGSKNIEYCMDLYRGDHNVTGDETCDIYIKTDTCEFPFKRYLAGKKYTVVIIIKNEVSKIVTPVGVNIYEVKKQGQLSVIVVPVAFSLVAVVLIVFGVAYYIQNRSRFIIEVADFNFGQQYSDMEYKTFRERLRDSITNAFTRGPSPSSSEVPVWPPGRK